MSPGNPRHRDGGLAADIAARHRPFDAENPIRRELIVAADLAAEHVTADVEICGGKSRVRGQHAGGIGQILLPDAAAGVQPP